MAVSKFFERTIINDCAMFGHKTLKYDSRFIFTLRILVLVISRTELLPLVFL